MKYLIGIVATAILLFVGFLGYLKWLTVPQVVHHQEDWANFHTKEVQPHFKLPKETVIVDATETTSFPMCYAITVKFKLPPTKSPEIWVQSIAKDSQMLMKRDSSYRIWRSQYKIERQEGDYKKVEYMPHSALYEVHWDWD